ncbi:TonB-dependent receptor [Marinibactrum halimedae]|uniref:TonB-dependent receptor n=1 Tax=Marinibactrum halimedae TaxID=1444977 RepID=A0AA37WKL5_9GAMM|nr:TonB-dependent receptor [Marinibactrum halimedae]MCD9460645.1 TonB-dependent receptor [Marinibactrum halimedae]GLS24290.1 TonB-dependent receptor [Marinibactrum halimedae]
MVIRNSYLKRTILASSITAALAGITSVPAYSQSEMLEEVVVTGIRGSLDRAMDIKRDSAGVVDAISAEDIGKFPDANLAESLQRITGVSIDRQNGEGNQITVRGLGPNFNMVTLNGRQMPAASSPEQESISSGTQSRAFNFAQIASESVSGVEVYKTARADLPTGGMGATVNIKTARPFDYDGTKVIANVAAIHDTSVVEGDDVTPEFGGLFSTLLADGKVGLLANFSFSERHSSEYSTHTDGWTRDLRDDTDSPYAFWCGDASSECNDAPWVYRPVTNISEIQHNQRERLNAQFVAQFAPVDNVEITLDYVMSDFERSQQRWQTGFFGVPGPDSVTNTRLTQNFTLDSVTRSLSAVDSLAYINELKVENESVGFNVQWDLTDTLTLSFDAHSSSAESQPGGELNDRLYLIQGPVGQVVDLDYSGNGVSVEVDDSGSFRNSDVEGERLPNIDNFQDPDGFSPLGTYLRNIAIENNVDQYQLDIDWDFDGIQLNAGVSYTDYEVNTLATDTGFFFQGLAPCPSCAEFINEPRNLDAPSGFQSVTTWNIQGLVQSQFPTQDSDLLAGSPPDFFGANEESLAFYFNMNTDFEIAGLPARLSAGARYETTDVTGSAFETFPSYLLISSDTEGSAVNADGATPVFYEVESDYSVFLPAVDFQIEPMEDHVARFSYGQSIARPDLNGLRPTTNISDFRPGVATASSGNPDLKPYSSDNFDLAYEWYYNDSSYLSITYFYKQVDDYITTSTELDTLLSDQGTPLLDPRGRYVPVGPDGDAIAVQSEPGDPEAIFEVSRLLNAEEREVDGFELAVQHIFGESGFGMQANYTIVESDAEYDVDNFEFQAVLLGLSDSWNLVGFYENERFSTRIAANWRDEFLFADNQLRRTGEPVYFDEYLQIDLSASYDITDNFAVSFEVLNLTGEDQVQRGRYSDQFLYENNQEPRYTLGLRANF